MSRKLRSDRQMVFSSPYEDFQAAQTNETRHTVDKGHRLLNVPGHLDEDDDCCLCGKRLSPCTRRLGPLLLLSLSEDGGDSGPAGESLAGEPRFHAEVFPEDGNIRVTEPRFHAEVFPEDGNIRVTEPRFHAEVFPEDGNIRATEPRFQLRSSQRMGISGSQSLVFTLRSSQRMGISGSQSLVFTLRSSQRMGISGSQSLVFTLRSSQRNQV
ncbi:hypothetical protein RRG08_059079 [Elysia crispata]|uniref:Uncharacterized protein n=1 Tax=Elysia crispata TaxID=231223 RepID=A0AAE1EBZ2_9GAST|nr:hypothetical protein RRG08_059079 [Elysia crispata]